MKELTLRRSAALLEVLGVTAAGPLMMWAIRHLIGLQLTNPLSTLRADISDHQLLVASGQMLELLLFQYCGYFLLAVPLNWWYRRKGIADYGVTRAGLSLRTLALAGVATAALAALPALTVGLVNSFQASETVGWRQALMDMPQRWQTWLFTATMSWALVPILEELFHRGYCLRRLAEDWGAGPAIVGSACLFTFGHSQYFLPNLYNAAMIVTLLFFAICVGIAFVITRSIIPGIVAHVVLNFPVPTRWQVIFLAVLLVAAVFAWRYGVTGMKRALRAASTSLVALLAVVSIAYELVMARDAIWPSVAATVLLMAAVLLEIRERGKASSVHA